MHTPGPWSLPHFAQPGAGCKCGYILVEGHMGAVATVHASCESKDWQEHGDNPGFDNCCANAKLIAAAPDLLAACQRMVNDSMFKDHPEASQMAIDAIAKATT